MICINLWDILRNEKHVNLWRKQLEEYAGGSILFNPTMQVDYSSWIGFLIVTPPCCFVACLLLSSLFSLDAMTLFHGLFCSWRRQGSHGAESHSPNASWGAASSCCCCCCCCCRCGFAKNPKQKTFNSKICNYTTHDLVIIMKTIQGLLTGNGWHHLRELQCKEVEFAEFEWACSMHLTSQGKGYRAPWYRRLKAGVQWIYEDSPKFWNKLPTKKLYIVGFWTCSPCLKLTA